MVLPDTPATIFEGEAEIAVVIGKSATNASLADAMKHVFGYTCFVDGSARGLVPTTNIFFPMKSRDTFAPIGPCIVTADEIADPHNLAITLKNNGGDMQRFNTSDMAHNIPRCIEWASAIQTLESGDIHRHRDQPSWSQFVHGRRQDRVHGREDRYAAYQREGRSEAHLGAHDASCNTRSRVVKVRTRATHR